MKYLLCFFVFVIYFQNRNCRDEDKIMKACYWPNEVYEPCFGGCAEVTCDNPRNHLRPCYPYCEPGCICEEPYVRDDRTHQCVLPQDCSPTQMGIPISAKKRGQDKQIAMTKYASRLSRPHSKRDETPLDLENEITSNALNSNINSISTGLKTEEYKRPSEVSRMGNYFNIVIAPPPIKTLQPRKLVQGDGYRNMAKRNS